MRDSKNTILRKHLVEMAHDCDGLKSQIAEINAHQEEYKRGVEAQCLEYEHTISELRLQVAAARDGAGAAPKGGKKGGTKGRRTACCTERVDQAPGACMLPAVRPLRRGVLIAGREAEHVFAQGLVPAEFFAVACVAVALAAGRRQQVQPRALERALVSVLVYFAGSFVVYLPAFLPHERRYFGLELDHAPVELFICAPGVSPPYLGYDGRFFYDVRY